MWSLRRRRRPELDLAVLDRLSDTIARAVALIEERLAPTPAGAGPRPAGELVIREEPRWPEPEGWPLEREQRREPEPEADGDGDGDREPEPEAEPEPVREAPVRPVSVPEPPTGFVLFVPTPAGYRLAAPDGLVPRPGERLRVEDVSYRVLRLGPSPLPGDRRRCVFLEPHPATLA